MTFIIPLTETRVKPHQVKALHMFVAFILIVAGAVLLMSAYVTTKMPLEEAMKYPRMYQYGQATGLGIIGFGAAILILLIAKNKWLKNPINNLMVRIAELLFLIVLSVGAIIVHRYVPAAVFGVLCATIVFAIFTEMKQNEPLQITIDNDGIRLPFSVRRRLIDWADVDYVIFRFGTLTVNMHNDSMMQWNIGDTTFEKEVLDVFCIQQINKAKERRDKNDW
ncbi:MAG: hypothetical protein JST82_10310 [Bacteroidetes bacterium]|nr:hypothetical protein [Bacteroidota bacterium]